MKKLIVVLALLGLYCYRGELMDFIGIQRYSLETITANPMPKQAVFDHWHTVGLELCDHEAQQRHNLSAAQCREKVEERHPGCLDQGSKKAPDKVADPQLAKELGREYLQCVTPYYFCKGMEVRSDKEVAAKCK